MRKSGVPLAPVLPQESRPTTERITGSECLWLYPAIISLRSFSVVLHGCTSRQPYIPITFAVVLKIMALSNSCGFITGCCVHLD